MTSHSRADDAGKVVKERLVGLDLLRFCAAMSVLFFHYALPKPQFPGFPAFPTLEPFALPGWVGVEVFFVLSGFVIAYSAEGSTAFKFFRSRVLRLCPTMWICSLITVAFGIVGAVFTWREALGRILRTWLFWPTGTWVDGAYWTLVIEVEFYTLIFVLLWSKRFKNIELVATVLGLTSVAYNLVDNLVTIPHQETFMLLLFQHGVFFALGIFLWLSTLKRLTVLRVVMICVCIVGGVAEIAHIAGLKAETVWAPAGIWIAAVGVIAVAPRLHLDSPLARTAGLMTYPLYLLHGLIGVVVMVALTPLLGRWGTLGVATGVALGLSLLVVLVLEPPVRAIVRRLIDGWKRRHDLMTGLRPGEERRGR